MMENPHLEFLVEEPSMEAFLDVLLPRLFPEDCPSFRVHAFQGKKDMLGKYRDPEAIKGGTWEAFERILQKGGYFKNGLRKVEVARTIAARINPDCNRSHSFVKFRDALVEAMAQCTAS